MKGLLIFHNNMEDAESIFTRDLLKRAGLEITTLSFSKKLITTSYNLEVNSDIVYTSNFDISSYDFLVIPGGKYVLQKVNYAKEIKDLILRFYNNNKYVCLICAAPYFLNDLNLNNDLKYTCYGDIYTKISNYTYTGKNVENSHKIITAKSAGYILDFSFEIIRSLLDENKVIEVKKQLLL